MRIIAQMNKKSKWTSGQRWDRQPPDVIYNFYRPIVKSRFKAVSTGWPNYVLVEDLDTGHRFKITSWEFVVKILRDSPEAYIGPNIFQTELLITKSGYQVYFRPVSGEEDATSVDERPYEGPSIEEILGAFR